MITVVTAPSRSGTSLTMQMLQAAGVPIIWNLLPNRTGINPRGHFELKGDDIQSFINFAPEGSAVKVMPWHLDRLPGHRSYQFILLLRDIAECRMSHDSIREGLGWLLHDTNNIEYWRTYASDFSAFCPYITITFNQLFTEEGPRRIGQFLKLSPLQVSKMRDCVEPSLRHFNGGL